jgi:hypothetical protein
MRVTTKYMQIDLVVIICNFVHFVIFVLFVCEVNARQCLEVFLPRWSPPKNSLLARLFIDDFKYKGE